MNKGGPAGVKEDEYPEKGIRFYQALMNQRSLDGLPGLLVAFKTPLTSVIKERLQPITQPSALSKVRKEQKGKECKSECELAKAKEAVAVTQINHYLGKAVKTRQILLAFTFGLVVAMYLPLTMGVIVSNLIQILR